MGIYDRDYYRREGPGYLETLIPSGQVCKWLIIINIAIFFVQMFGNRPGPELDEEGHRVPVLQSRNRIVEILDLEPARVMAGQVWRLLTYAFLHTSGWQVFFNMLFLWWFGSELERMYGPREFLAYYLCAVLAGGLAGMTYYLMAHQPGPEELLLVRDLIPGLGASAAVTALLLLFACHFPTQNIYVVKLVPVPIWLFLLFHVGQDTFSFASHSVSYNAALAHGSAALFGFVYYRQHWQIMGLFRSLRSWQFSRARPRLRLYRPEPLERESVPVPAAAPSVLDEHLEAKLDAVLEKVARYGQGSLTDAERQILFKASEIYKRNRT